MITTYVLLIHNFDSNDYSFAVHLQCPAHFYIDSITGSEIDTNPTGLDAIRDEV